MNGRMVASKPLYVALAQRKEERRARLQVCSPTYFVLLDQTVRMNAISIENLLLFCSV